MLASLPGSLSVPTRLLIVAAALIVAVAAPSAQSPSANAGPASDLDTFMAQVLLRRDDNWKKLQQYVLDEDEVFQLTGPDARRMYGFHREYTWFPRDGFFIRSPLRVDGVAVPEGDRRKAEEAWLHQEQGREQRRAERAAGTPARTPAPGVRPGEGVAGSESSGRNRNESGSTSADASDATSTTAIDGGSGADGVLQDLRSAVAAPRFVSTAYFMRFRFDPGHYALVGREQLLGRDVLRIEYYPTRLFQEGRTRPNKKLRDDDETINRKLNKVAFVTLWVEPNEHQILQYEFRNIDMDFLPGRSIVRLDDLQASMRMGQPFNGVWLPDTIAMQFGMTLAIGAVTGQYAVHYRDYRLADVKTRIR